MKLAAILGLMLQAMGWIAYAMGFAPLGILFALLSLWSFWRAWEARPRRNPRFIQTVRQLNRPRRMPEPWDL